MEHNKANYEKKYQAELDELRAQFDQLVAKAEQADAKARIQMSVHLDRLESKQKELEKRVDGLRKAGRGAWEDLKQGLDNAFDETKYAFSSARSHFRTH